MVLTVGGDTYKISLTDDNPNAVKVVFNELIVKLKSGKFTFSLDDEESDLFHYICEEYIKQLEKEIADVYSELNKNGLVVRAE